MNREESIAETFLQLCSAGNVRHEPDGNIPPDFSLDSKIGVEVRRLNQNFVAKGKAQGLEEVSIPLFRGLSQLFTSFDACFDGHTYWIILEYKRPLLGGPKAVIKHARTQLDQFLKGTRKLPTTLTINKCVHLTIIAATPRPNQVFRLGIEGDDDSGGAVVQMYIDNIKHCIDIKTQKVTPYKQRYGSWWLLLVDTMMAWDLLPEEVAQIKDAISDIGGFDKLIVIDFLGTTRLLELDN